MIGQIRPGPKELEKRRWGPRDYDPRYYLYQDIDVGDPDSWKDPKPLKHPPKLHETESGERVYTSRWGTLNKDLREKFANHLNWTSDMRDNIIGLPILNAHKPPPKNEPRLHPSTETIRRIPMRYESGPQEHQQIGRDHGYLHEWKAWPNMDYHYRQFPLDVGERSKLTWTLEDRSGRTPQEEQLVRNTIREYVRQNVPFMPQYIRREPTQVSMKQKEIRPFEKLKRPADRNPPWWRSETVIAHRRFPSYEYRCPKFSCKGPMARTVTVVHPFVPNNLIKPSLKCRLKDKTEHGRTVTYRRDP